MLKKIAEIFEKEVKKEIPEFDESQLATTSLMILTAKYDGEFDEVEKDEILKMRIAITMSEDRIYEGYSYPHKAKGL